MQTQLLQLRALHEPKHVMGRTGFPLLGLSPAEQAASVTLTDWSLRNEQQPRGAGIVLSMQVCSSPSPHLPKSTANRVSVSSSRAWVQQRPSLLQPGLLWSLPRRAQNHTRHGGHSLLQ